MRKIDGTGVNPVVVAVQLQAAQAVTKSDGIRLHSVAAITLLGVKAGDGNALVRVEYVAIAQRKSGAAVELIPLRPPLPDLQRQTRACTPLAVDLVHQDAAPLGNHVENVTDDGLHFRSLQWVMIPGANVAPSGAFHCSPVQCASNTVVKYQTSTTCPIIGLSVRHAVCFMLASR